MYTPIKSPPMFEDLPRCIVCGHPILKNHPVAQFADGVAHVNKRQGRRHSCKILAEGAEIMIPGLAMPDDDWLPGAIKPPSGDELYTTEMRRQRGSKDGHDGS